MTTRQERPDLTDAERRLVDEMEAAGAAVTFTESWVLRRVTVAWNGNTWISQDLDAYPVAKAFVEFTAIREMETAGYTVRLTETIHECRVRVSRKEGGRTVYSAVTSSTSGYPILRAYAKWRDAVGSEVAP